MMQSDEDEVVIVEPVTGTSGSDEYGSPPKYDAPKQPKVVTPPNSDDYGRSPEY